MESGRTDDEFPQFLPSDLNIGAIATVMRGQLVGERNTPKAITIREHGEKIEALRRRSKRRVMKSLPFRKLYRLFRSKMTSLKARLTQKTKRLVP